jgi:ornithine cyclodeaminase/alanine dehydrogenase-like protein (mu-crystallin family)
VVAAQHGEFAWESALDLGNLVYRRWRPPREGCMLFESQGLTLTDVAASWLVYKAQGL